MPIEIDMMESPIVRDYFLRGQQEGARKEAVTLLIRQIERRFGAIPEAATRKLNEADLATLEDWSLRLLDAQSIEEALRTE